MYTSIPLQDAIMSLIYKLDELGIRSLGGFSTEQLESLLTVLLQNTYFEFLGKYFHQIRGLPMGSSLSGALAIIFMDSIERRALSNANNIPFFRRYVDDCFALVNSAEDATNLLNILNRQHENIKFEIELFDDNNTLNLLDFGVTLSIDNGPIFEFYRKSARKNLFTHFDSHLPSHVKFHFIKNERQRIYQRCSNIDTFNKHMTNFNTILRHNGYPEEYLQLTKRRLDAKHSSRGSKKKQEQKMANRKKEHQFFFRFPYISDKIDHQIKKIFKRENMNVQITRRTRTLRNCLNAGKHQTSTCKLKDCPIRDNNICHRKMVIYRLTCINCQQFYIGSTTRQLHIRCKEHSISQQSSMFQHQRNCNNLGFKTEIIGRDFDAVNLHLREAAFILKFNPTINSKSEQLDNRHFLYHWYFLWHDITS